MHAIVSSEIASLANPGENHTYTADNPRYMFVVSVSEPLQTWTSQMKNLLLSASVEHSRRATSTLTWLVLVTVAYAVVAYFSTFPFLRSLVDTKRAAIGLLLHVPAPIVLQSETIRSYLENGASINKASYKDIVDEQEKKTRMILNACKDPVIVTNESGTMELVNPATEDLSGFDVAELLGKPIGVLMGEEFSRKHADAAATVVEEAKKGKRKQFLLDQSEFVLCCKDGTTIPVLVSTAMAITGAGISFAMFAKDIRHIKDHEAALDREQKRADALLHNILPGPVVERLKRSPGKLVARKYHNVSVMFADIVGFTPTASGMRPEDLVMMLNDLFSPWDELCETYDVEKIKTIGDCYMAVSGLDDRADHAEHMIEFALAAMNAVRDFNASRSSKSQKQISLRVGIHSGSIVAGVIGSRKWAFDIWGDTVNVASRLESSGLAGRIQVSQETYQLTKDKFPFDQRGPVQIKGKGEMECYLLAEDCHFDGTPKFKDSTGVRFKESNSYGSLGSLHSLIESSKGMPDSVADAETAAESSSSGVRGSSTAWTAIAGRSAPGRMGTALVLTSFQTLSSPPWRSLELACALVELLQVATFAVDGEALAGSAASPFFGALSRVRDPVASRYHVGAFVPMALALLAYPMAFAVQFASVLRGGRKAGAGHRSLYSLQRVYLSLMRFLFLPCPFTRKSCNYVFAGVCSATACSSLLTIGAVYSARDPAKVALSLVSLALMIPGGLLGYLLVRIRLGHPNMRMPVFPLSVDPNSRFKNAFGYDMASRFIYTTKDLTENAIATADAILDEGTRDCPDSNYLRLAHAIMTMEVIHDISRVKAVLLKAESERLPPWDLSYMLYCLSKSTATHSAVSSKEEIELGIAEGHHRDARKLMADFWGILASTKKNIDHNELLEIIASISLHERQGDATFRKLLSNNLKSCVLLRKYGKFLQEIRDDQEQAEIMFQLAESIEAPANAKKSVPKLRVVVPEEITVVVDDEDPMAPKKGPLKPDDQSETGCRSRSQSNASALSSMSMADLTEDRARVLEFRAHASTIKSPGVVVLHVVLVGVFLFLIASNITVFLLSRNGIQKLRDAIGVVDDISESARVIYDASLDVREVEVLMTGVTGLPWRTDNISAHISADLDQIRVDSGVDGHFEEIVTTLSDAAYEYTVSLGMAARLLAATQNTSEALDHDSYWRYVMDNSNSIVEKLFALAGVHADDVSQLIDDSRSYTVRSVFLANELIVNDRMTWESVAEIQAEAQASLSARKAAEQALLFQLGIAHTNGNDEEKYTWFIETCPQEIQELGLTCVGLGSLQAIVASEIASLSNPGENHSYTWDNARFVFVMSVFEPLEAWTSKFKNQMLSASVEHSRSATSTLTWLVLVSVAYSIVAYFSTFPFLRSLVDTKRAAIGLLLHVPAPIDIVDEQEKKTRMILNACKDPVIVTNESGTMELVNPATEDLSGFDVAELLGKPIGVLMGEEFSRKHADAAATVVEEAKKGKRKQFLLDQSEFDIRHIKDHEAALDREQKRADALLHNILPGPVVERLKRSPGKLVARKYHNVSVMFADIVGFTPTASGMRPEDLVMMLNDLFSPWDELCENYNVEKIKTIGDCYMAVSGLDDRADHAEHMIEFALAAMNAVRDFNASRSSKSQKQISLRVGIHSGSIVAGVIGSRKWAFDIWGDTVNVASRLESSGIANRIQVSQETYQLTKDKFPFDLRGPVQIKGKGEMECYLLAEDCQFNQAPKRKDSTGVRFKESNSYGSLGSLHSLIESSKGMPDSVRVEPSEKDN
eukprot:m51a1_g2950 putative protein (1781) ;mRNA; f:630546-638735